MQPGREQGGERRVVDRGRDRAGGLESGRLRRELSPAGAGLERVRQGCFLEGRVGLGWGLGNRRIKVGPPLAAMCAVSVTAV